MRSSACLLAIVLVAGCASTPEESLVWSALARSLPREKGDVVEVARFSRAPPGAIGKPWEPYFVLRGNVPTMYRVVQLEESTALEADAEEGGSGLYRKIRIDLKRHPVLEWRWRVPPDPDTRLEISSWASPLVRLSLARVRMIGVESGARRIGEWVSIRRNVLEDYRRAFGEEPSDVLAVGLMTDPGDDGSRRRSFYGDITFRSDK